MATMRDIALLAGVSTATVSHVVNGTKKLSPETTERVLMAIQEANYTPNTLRNPYAAGKPIQSAFLLKISADFRLPESSAESMKHSPSPATA